MYSLARPVQIGCELDRPYRNTEFTQTGNIFTLVYFISAILELVVNNLVRIEIRTY